MMTAMPANESATNPSRKWEETSWGPLLRWDPGTSAGQWNPLIHQYLIKCGLDSVARHFLADCQQQSSLHFEPIPSHGAGGAVGLVSKQQERMGHCMAKLSTHFRRGEQQAFFSRWNEEFVLAKAPSSSLPPEPSPDDQLAQIELEFHLHLYFAVHPALGVATTEPVTYSRHSLQAFKEFIETKGSVLCQREDYLRYYALPYVPDPRHLPAFKGLFEASWAQQLARRMNHFVESRFQQAMHVQPPVLVQAFQDAVQLLPAVESAHRRADTLLLEQYRTLQLEHDSLIGVASSLVEMLSMVMSGHPLDTSAVEQAFQTLISLKHVPVRLTQHSSTSSSLFGLSTVSLKQGLHVGDHRLPPVSPLDTFHARLDFSQIKEVLGRPLSSTLSEEPARHIAFLLQALRMRLELGPRTIRMEYLRSFISQDILSISSRQTSVIEYCLDISYPYRFVTEQALKFMNTISRYHVGRDWILSKLATENNPCLLDKLCERWLPENINGGMKRISLILLQRLSIRRRVQSFLIQKGFVSQLFSLLSQHVELDDEILEFTAALLMNLCLRTAGKQVCLLDSRACLRPVMELFETKNFTVRAYILAILYSLLSLSEAREAAKAMGLADMLKHYREAPENSFTFQLDLIESQMSQDAAGDVPDAASDDGSEADMIDDDEELLLAQEENEELKVHNNEVFGPAFLARYYETDSNSEKYLNLSIARPISRSVSRAQNALKLNAGSSSTVRPSIGATSSSEKSNHIYASQARTRMEPLPVANYKETILPPPPSQKTLDKLNSLEPKLILEEYNEAFSTKSRVLRTPSATYQSS